jgi:hypothetical protein
MVYHFARNFFSSTQRAELTFNGVMMSDIHKKESYEIPYSQITRIYLGINRGKSRRYFCEITDNNNYITTIFHIKPIHQKLLMKDLSLNYIINVKTTLTLFVLINLILLVIGGGILS